MRRRRFGFVGVCAGIVLLLGSVVVHGAVAPALVRFPLNVDETAHYTGRALTYVDQKTLLPLAKPTSVPLTVDRHVRVVSGTYSRAVVAETITIRAGSTKSVENYQYVMDRRSMRLLDDPREYAFGDKNAAMHAAGAYRVNFAMGTTAHGSYRSFIPEANVSAPLVLVEGRHYHGDARVNVIDFKTKLVHPVAPYYLDHLKAMGLPMQISTAQLQPQLAAAGVDVNKALADVGSILTPAESRLVTDTLGKPIPLRYYFIADGMISIEPKTGALVDVHSTEEGVAVKPDLAGASALNTVLKKYSSIPSVKAAADGLATLTARGPQRAQMFVYTQTVPSSLHLASNARQQASKMNLIETGVPGGMLILGGALLMGGLLAIFGPRRRAATMTTESAPSVGAEPEPELAPTERSRDHARV